MGSSLNLWYGCKLSDDCRGSCAADVGLSHVVGSGKFACIVYGICPTGDGLRCVGDRLCGASFGSGWVLGPV